MEFSIAYFCAQTHLYFRSKVGNGISHSELLASLLQLQLLPNGTLNKTIYVVLRVDRKVCELCQDLFCACVVGFSSRSADAAALLPFWRLLALLLVLLRLLALPLRLLVRAVYLHNVGLSRNLRFVFGAHKSVAAATAAAGCKFRSQLANKRLGHKSLAAI